MDENKLVELFTSLLDQKLNPINEKLSKLEGGQQSILDKLDYITSQVAENIEMKTNIDEVVLKVEEHDTDIKMIKKILTN